MSSPESLGTCDGILPSDWETVEDLTASIYNSLDTPEEVECRSELLSFLDSLDRKYGPRPSLLAVRGDFTTEGPSVRKELYAKAYALAVTLTDPINSLFVCHSMCELCVETNAPRSELAFWMKRFRLHLDETPDSSMEREYEDILKRLATD